MATDQPPGENPITIGAEPVYFFDGAAAVPPAGTAPPPRPAEMERVPLPPGTVRGWEYIEIEGTAVVPPSGTLPPPRPPGQERLPVTPIPQANVAALVARIEAALDVIHTALAEIKRVQNPSQLVPQSKAG